MTSLSRRVDVGGHSLRIATSGSGSRHFLCLHGLVDTLEIWDPIAEELGRRGRVTRLDQRAHGESDAPPGAYTREDLANDAIATLDALGVERSLLVGHSLGGIVAMTTALAHPDRVSGLVLIGTASHCNEKTAGWYEKIARAGEQDGIDGIRTAIYGAKSRKSIRGDAAGIARVTRTLKSLYADPLTPKLGHLRCPALLLVGENDPMGPRASERIAERLPPGAATLEVLSGCGHWVHVERPEAVLAALDRWLEDQEKTDE